MGRSSVGTANKRTIRLIQTIDLILRFATISQLLFLAVLLVRDRRRSPAGLLAAVFALGVSSYMLCGLAGIEQTIGVWAYPLLVGCFGNPVFFWLLARAMFDDRFRLRPWHGILLVAVETIAFGYYLGRPVEGFFANMPNLDGLAPVASILPQLIALALVIAALVSAFAGRAADLVESRRRFRTLFVRLTGSYMVLVAAVEILLAGSRASALAELLNVSVIYGLSFWFSVAAVRMRTEVLSVAPAKPRATDELSATDRRLFDALTRTIEQEQAYREEGLTIGDLARRLGTGEHRLRRLINNGMGFRNFNEFLNAHRVRAARDLLVGAESAHLPVLTIAMDLGYRSLGPFNRAFKEQTGMTPTAYRRSRLAEIGSNDQTDGAGGPTI